MIMNHPKLHILTNQGNEINKSLSHSYVHMCVHDKLLNMLKDLFTHKTPVKTSKHFQNFCAS